MPIYTPLSPLSLETGRQASIVRLALGPFKRLWGRVNIFCEKLLPIWMILSLWRKNSSTRGGDWCKYLDCSYPLKYRPFTDPNTRCLRGGIARHDPIFLSQYFLHFISGLHVKYKWILGVDQVWIMLHGNFPKLSQPLKTVVTLQVTFPRHIYISPLTFPSKSFQELTSRIDLCLGPGGIFAWLW